MPFAPARSLLNPYGPEPLPLYTPRQSAPHDSETASIRSDAPSYVSAAPSYHSSAPPHHIRACDLPSAPPSNVAREPGSSTSPAGGSLGLPPAQSYAPGFENRNGQSVGSPSPANLRSLYNVAEWVPATGGLQARHYHNVANRRATEGASMLNNRSIFPTLMSAISNTSPIARFESAVNFPRRFTAPSMSTGSSSLFEQSHNAASSDSVNNTLTRTTPPQGRSTTTLTEEDPMELENEEDIPFSPHEDPDLVGEEAAARARSQRLYITYQQQENGGQQPPPFSSGSRPQESRHPGHVYQYRSLISPSSTPQVHRYQSASPNNETSASTESSPRNTTQTNPTASTGSSLPSQSPPQPQRHPPRTHRPHLATASDEALRAQESATWDFMLAQMASMEERERGWKRFREDVDRRLTSAHSGLRMGMGMGFGALYSGNSGGSGSGGPGGKRKLRKQPSWAAKKWKSKVGLAS